MNLIEEIKKINNSCDFTTRTFKIRNHTIDFIYFESVSSDDKISDFIGKTLSWNVTKKKMFQNIFKTIESSLPNSKLKIIEKKDIFYHLSSGFTIINIRNYNKYIALETKKQLDRGVTESISESVMKGPKDSFTENYQTNIGLIRKRIKDNNLVFEEQIVGRRSKTKVSIAYIKDIASNKKVQKLIEKIKNIDIDYIGGTSYIKELIIGNQKSIFPRVISTERPDITCNGLLNGKIIIMVENSPYAMIIPGLFTDFFNSAEDYYGKPINVSMTRILRFIAFFIAIIIPAFYISVTTYNTEIIPDSLLISFAIQKEGVPFPTFVEVLILIIAYEILRESDARKPKIMGASISIVGALILGDASVSAGIISPIVVIVVSLSAISGMIFTDIDMINAVRWWRIIFMLFASILGMVGIFICGVLLIIKLCSLEIMEVPYLAPLSPIYLNEWKSSIFRASRKKNKYRPPYLTKNIIRKGD